MLFLYVMNHPCSSTIVITPIQDHSWLPHTIPFWFLSYGECDIHSSILFPFRQDEHSPTNRNNYYFLLFSFERRSTPCSGSTRTCDLVCHSCLPPGVDSLSFRSSSLFAVVAPELSPDPNHHKEQWSHTARWVLCKDCNSSNSFLVIITWKDHYCFSISAFTVRSLPDPFSRIFAFGSSLLWMLLSNRLWIRSSFLCRLVHSPARQSVEKGLAAVIASLLQDERHLSITNESHLPDAKWSHSGHSIPYARSLPIPSKCYRHSIHRYLKTPLQVGIENDTHCVNREVEGPDALSGTNNATINDIGNNRQPNPV